MNNRRLFAGHLLSPSKQELWNYCYLSVCLFAAKISQEGVEQPTGTKSHKGQSDSRWLNGGHHFEKHSLQDSTGILMILPFCAVS